MAATELDRPRREAVSVLSFGCRRDRLRATTASVERPEVTAVGELLLAVPHTGRVPGGPSPAEETGEPSIHPPSCEVV